MNPFSFVYTELLYRPLLNLLVGITDVLPTNNIGLAIILVTLIVRLVLLPSSLHHARQMQKNQNKMKDVQQEIKKIQKQYKNDRAKQAEATMAIYRKAGINPAQGCLPLLIQLPILIALYRVFLSGLQPETLQHLYSFIPAPEHITTSFLGVALDTPSLMFGVVAGLAQFVQMRFFTSISPTPPAGADANSTQMMASMQKNMMYIFPAMTVFIALRLPAALALYWVTTTAFAMIQQYILRRTLHLTSNPPPL